MAHLSPSAIFSPSVARQQLASAKDWNYIDSWLSTKFNGKTPPFERNNDTLKALLALAALNESADEEREFVARVEAKALAELRSNEVSNDPHTQLLDSLQISLTREGKTGLDALSALIEAVNQPPLPDIEKLGRSLIGLQLALSDLNQAGSRIFILENHLNYELGRITRLIEDLQGENYQAPSESTKQTVDSQRKTKLMTARLPELRDRVASLSATLENPKIGVMDVKAQEEVFKEAMIIVKDLESQVKTYHGLPQDMDLARLELESVRVELRDLMRQRDGLFEGLVERESPKKTRH